MTASVVSVSFPRDGVGQVLQNTGPKNFSTFAASEQMLEALQAIRDEGCRVAVIGSEVEGKFIGHGWLPDVVDAFTDGKPSGDPRAGWRLFEELDAGPLVTMAAIDGEAWGHGAELAWACDLRIVSKRATLGQDRCAIRSNETLIISRDASYSELMLHIATR